MKTYEYGMSIRSRRTCCRPTDLL